MNDRLIACLPEEVQTLPGIGPHSSFRELGFDSLDLLQFVVDVDKSFGVMIPHQESKTLRTLGDVSEWLKRHECNPA